MGQDPLFEPPASIEEKRSEKPRDEVWDALEEAFGPVRTKDERGRRNRACRQLREAGATPEEIQVAVDYCERNFTIFTEMAVCGWLSRALHERKDSGDFANVFELAMKEQERHDRL